MVVFLPLISTLGFAQTQLPIFSDAVGHGRFTVGGSGRHLSTPSTTVYRINTLSSGTEGPTAVGDGTFHSSFLTAAQQSGPKVIIFEISGTIDFGATQVSVNGDYVTIAGQTAPSPGITIRVGRGLKAGGSNLLFQHFRVGSGGDIASTAGSDVLSTPNGAGNHIYWDHISVRWGTDENIANRDPDDMTVAWCITSEALHNPPTRPGANHSNAMRFGYPNERVTIAYNLLALADARNPRMSNQGSLPTSFEVINNYIYGYRRTGTQNSGSVVTDIIGNFYDPGPFSGASEVQLTNSTTIQRAYVQGNVGPNWSTPNAANNWAGVSGSITNRSLSRLTPVTNVPILDARTLESVILPNVGARPLDRDEVDARIIDWVLTGQGSIIDHENEVGGYPDLAVNTISHVLPSNFNEVTPSGYTKLELWLDSLKRDLETFVTSPVASVTQPVTGPGLFNFNEPGNQPGTAVNMDVTSVNGSGSMTVSRFAYGPSNPTFPGTPPANISEYMWEISQSGLSSLSAEVRFNILEFPMGITDPNTVIICSRPTVGSGQFNELVTTYNSASNELRATVSGLGEYIFISDDNPLTDVKQQNNTPERFTLGQNYPNPFNPSTLIQFAIGKESRVRLNVYNVLGELVRTLVDDIRSAGSYAARLDAAGLASGLYLYRLQAGEFVETRKLLVLR